MGRFFQDDLPDTSICVKPDKIDLNDCLACSGCITDSEKAAFKVDASFLANTGPTYSFILSSHSKMSLSRLYPAIDYHSFEKSLVGFLKRHFKVHLIVDTSYFRKQGEAGISSECPAVVLYVEKVFPTLLGHLSTSKTYQQIAAEYIRDSAVNVENHKTVAVMQCYDKKDELRRDATHIDHFIGTAELYEFLRVNFTPENTDIQIQPWEMSHRQEVKEIAGIETCINHLNRIKAKGISEFLELRICKNGCINGPAQARVEKEELTASVDVEDEDRIYFDADRRVFTKPKRRTFNVEW